MILLIQNKQEYVHSVKKYHKYVQKEDVLLTFKFDYMKGKWKAHIVYNQLGNPTVLCYSKICVLIQRCLLAFSKTFST